MAKVSEMQHSIELPSRVQVFSHKRTKAASLWQVIRFGMVGVLNTLVDVVILNFLLWYFPTHNANLLLIYNSIAYTIGAVNSFGLNKYWTFQHKRRVNGGEVTRFALISIVGICCNDGILWLMAKLLHPSIGNNLLWANTSKLTAVIGTAIISYLGMRLWVFASAGQGQGKKSSGGSMLSMGAQEHKPRTKGELVGTKHSLSVVMPAHNEEVAIAATVSAAVEALANWTQDYEVIVVNDGSKDGTRAIVEEIATVNPRVRLINHDVNQGYGAALVSGFEASEKDLVFFMDSDGQFDIRDLERFFPLIEEYDAVLGYRIDRQDTWMRKLNAWGWKMLVRVVFKLRVRDIDCAFKLYRGQFFREHRLETRGAMINTELLYKFRRAGYTYTEVGVQHLPRRGGKATGAKLSVIARAFREMFTYARKWHQEERQQKA
ncbi:MAG TPA: glycosyltransferase [Ktedonosporobacter sp.]|nr:glycosyltransferase [Ktedonosporobacter sp.]